MSCDMLGTLLEKQVLVCCEFEPYTTFILGCNIDNDLRDTKYSITLQDKNGSTIYNVLASNCRLVLLYTNNHQTTSTNFLNGQV